MNWSSSFISYIPSPLRSTDIIHNNAGVEKFWLPDFRGWKHLTVQLPPLTLKHIQYLWRWYSQYSIKSVMYYTLFANVWEVIAYSQTCSCVSSISFRILSKCISFIGIFLSNRVISGKVFRRNPICLHKASEWVLHFANLSLIRRNAFSWPIISQII